MKNIALKDVSSIDTDIQSSYAEDILSTVASLHGRLKQMFCYQIELNTLLNKYSSDELEEEQELSHRLHDDLLLEPTILYACVKTTITLLNLKDKPTFLQRFGINLSTSQKLCKELTQLQKRFDVKELSMEEVAIQRDIRSSANSLILDLLPNFETKIDFLKVHQYKISLDIQKVEFQRDDYKRQLELLQECVSSQHLKQKEDEIKKLNEALERCQVKIELLEQELRLKDETITLYSEQIKNLKLKMMSIEEKTSTCFEKQQTQINELTRVVKLQAEKLEQSTPMFSSPSIPVPECKESSFSEASSLNLSSISSKCFETPHNSILFKEKRNAKVELIEHLVASYIEQYEAHGTLPELRVEGLAQPLQDEVKRQMLIYIGAEDVDAHAVKINPFILAWRSRIADIIAHYMEQSEEAQFSSDFAV